jgi:hypothetical protein
MCWRSTAITAGYTSCTGRTGEAMGMERCLGGGLGFAE